jgi:hypothetical protein
MEPQYKPTSPINWKANSGKADDIFVDLGVVLREPQPNRAMRSRRQGSVRVAVTVKDG